MTKFFGLLTASILVSLLAFGGRPNPVTTTATREATEAPTVAATRQAADLANGLHIDPQMSEEENAHPKLTIKIIKPVLSGPDGDIVNNFNKAVDAIIQSGAGEFKADVLNPQSQGSATLPAEIEALGNSYDIRYEIVHSTESLISVRFFEYFYYAGAAHPGYVFVSLNFDLQAAKVLALSDLFLPKSTYLDALATYSVKTLKAKARLDFPEGATPTEINYQTWNIEPKGLLITFQDYQVTPHAVGYQEVLVPYSVLRSLIEPKGLLAPYIQ